MIQLPNTVTQYFEASNRQAIEQMVECFADEAVVHDVGEDLEMKGLPSIRAWLEESRSKYQLITRPLELTGAADDVEVLAEVSGNFDGSPLKFRYRFKLKGSSIMFLSTTYVDE